MMAAAKKPVAKKRSNTTRKTANHEEIRRSESRRLWSIILFSLGLLTIPLTFIEGGGLWNKLYINQRGLFGISVFLVAPEIIYVSVMLARDKSKYAVATKILQGVILILLTSGIAQIIAVGSVTGNSFLDKLTGLVKDGVNLRGGGICSALLGWPLLALFKRTGATIIIILLTFIFIMLLTNLTLIDLFNFISKPFRKGYSAVKEGQLERVKEIAEAKQEKQEKKGAKVAPEKIPKSERKNKRVDVAKYIQDENENNAEDSISDSTPVKPIVDSTVSQSLKDQDDEFGDFILPIPISGLKGKKKITIDKNAEKNEAVEDSDIVAKEKKKPASKKKEDKILEDIIKKALPKEKNQPAINPLYVEKDGQTTFFDKDNSAPVYKEPPVSLLKYSKSKTNNDEIQNEIKNKSDTLISTLQSFGVQSRIVGIHRGPSVTRYELQPAAGVKVSKITGLADDIALNLAAEGVRLEAPIPGKAAIGIEIANKHRDMVSIRELIDSPEYRASKGKLTFAVGKDIEGKIVIGNISKMPHLLIAGTTGSGKSVFTNSIIMNILYHASPEDVKLILIDPKQVEFPIYNGIPHLLIPVVTESRKAAGALGWAVTEMTRRYNLFAESGVRDLDDYNEYVKTQEDVTKLSQVVIIIDELADLMMAAPKEVEESICRIAQLARAAGMHLIIATQSPRVDVVTGLIKANIPSRIALKVSNNMDSRVILDEGGAEKLLGNGDMLYKPVGIGKPKRVQGSYVPTSEVREVVNFLKNQISAKYDDEIIEEIEKNTPAAKGEKIFTGDDNDGEPKDPMLEEAITVVLDAEKASTSYLQRQLKLGYGRAARIMDEMELMGIIGPADGSKPRKTLITKEQWLEKQAMS